MSRIPAGVVGVGKLGAEHARLLAQSDAFELEGVHDRSAARANKVAGALSVPAFADAEALLDRVEAVVVAVPTVAHHEAAAAAIRAGCHVLVEKPLTTSLGEADEILALAEERGVVLGVGHVERFNGILLAADPWLDRPRFIESLRMAPFQPRGADTTVILDLMIHDIDLVLTLTEAPLADVRAVGVPVISPRIDLANARLSFEDGTVANITASRVALKAMRKLRLFQRSGYFSLDLAAETGHHYRRRDPRTVTAITGVEALVEHVPLEARGGEALARELEAFADAIAGRPSRLVSGRAGREALEVAIRITREIEEFVHVVAQDS
ncbi:Gfo/Idh/MocA family oxidoreductase [Candidatus Palauibacter soopunensis]|uniref:Gfo/Idh/MocA family protein n=1 Tax=Candidatus Palauibacter soopunensis TaxID=3056739 RepID=UPI002391C6E3|nr:Gfo/Idh/MocA family oxidoreductase [Candidatus Palauibacter soopunensis]MDE2880166.1 Gfo/Idh/MocA family oxidoreductase [Candidatus Palauibacter soopunensis]